MCDLLKERFPNSVGEGYAHFLLGNYNQIHGDFTKSHEEFAKALELGVKEPGVYQGLSNTTNTGIEDQIAIYQQMRKDLNAPDTDLSGAVAIAELYYNMGKFYPDKAKDAFPKSEAMYRYALQKYPDTPLGKYAKYCLTQNLKVKIGDE